MKKQVKEEYVIKKVIIAGQEVEVKIYPETKKRASAQMKTRGKQTHDSTLGDTP